MLQAQLSISWESLPNYCFAKSAGKLEEHACLIRVTTIVRQDDRLRHLVEAKGDYSQKLMKVLAMPGTRSPMHHVSRSSLLGVLETPVCPLYRVLSSTSCFLVGETVGSDCLQWNVVGESVGAVNTLVRRLRRGGVSAKVVSVEKISGGRRLTDRQEQILRQAYERGFFESPHETNVRELANALNCSPSTLIRLLRKAEKKVLAERFRTGPTPRPSKSTSGATGDLASTEACA